MEAYRGLAILTTNMKSALDQAFLRRIRFIVNFPFPDTAAREQIWRRQFPPDAPLGDVDFTALARLNLPGGNIRSIAVNAAFKAADAGTCIEQSLLATAAHEEFAEARTLDGKRRDGRHGMKLGGLDVRIRRVVVDAEHARAGGRAFRSRQPGPAG